VSDLVDGSVINKLKMITFYFLSYVLGTAEAGFTTNCVFNSRKPTFGVKKILTKSKNVTFNSLVHLTCGLGLLKITL
jgi:hypothetical protein